MALRLDDLVLCGEIYNTSHYSTHGWLRLQGQEQTLSLQLTGDCSADLAGRQIRFEARDADAREQLDEPGEIDLGQLAWQQVGPTGEMTAGRLVKVSDCSPEELSKRAKPGEPPPFEQKRCLYLEWFSQNGRVVVELVDPIIEFIDRPESAAAASDAQPGNDLQDENESSGASGGLDAGLDDDNGDGAPPAGIDLSSLDFADDNSDLVEDESLLSDDDDGEHDPYGLFPDDLQQQFDLEASQLDRSIEDDESKPNSLRELELMDELIEGGEGDIIASIFEQPMKLPRPEQLDDDQVEAALKALLGQLALFGIALAVCEHFSPRDAYRLLVDDICTEERAYPELKNTQWVQHFMTSEFCEQCEAEMEREFEEYERKRRDNPDDDVSGGDEMPF